MNPIYLADVTAKTGFIEKLATANTLYLIIALMIVAWGAHKIFTSVPKIIWVALAVFITMAYTGAKH
jgi:hypothetical protein